jgi:hypothetical protein
VIEGDDEDEVKKNKLKGWEETREDSHILNPPGCEKKWFLKRRPCLRLLLYIRSLHLVT